MSTKLKITVTKEILERSKMCGSGDDQGYNCAVALAVRDIFPKAYCYQSCMLVDGDEDTKIEFESNLQNLISIKPHLNVIRFPEKVFLWIKRFDKATPDQRVSLNPISFEIEIPDEVINQINIDELKPLLINHPNLKLVDHE